MTIDEHLAGSERFLKFADGLRLAGGDATAVGWALTAVFYASLHATRAYFAMNGHNADSHECAKRLMLADAKVRVLRADYEFLKQTSEKARYYLDLQSDWRDYASVRRRAVTVLKACFKLTRRPGFDTAPRTA